MSEQITYDDLIPLYTIMRDADPRCLSKTQKIILSIYSPAIEKLMNEGMSEFDALVEIGNNKKYHTGLGPWMVFCNTMFDKRQ